MLLRCFNMGLAMALMCCCIVPARAGQYVLASGSPSGGSTAVPASIPGYPKSYANENPNYGGGYASHTSSPAGQYKCTGAVTYNWTWQPSYNGEQPPLSVILTEFCVASASWNGKNIPNPAPTAAADDGLNDVAVNSQGESQSSGTHYQLVSGGAQVTYTFNPSATLTNKTTDPVELSVTCCVTVTPVVLNLAGALQPPLSNEPGAMSGLEILVGQLCKASITAAGFNLEFPCPYWGISGGDPYASFSPGTPQNNYTRVLTPVNFSASSPSFYFSSGGSSSGTNVSVSGVAEVYDPTGGDLGPAPAGQNVNVWLPKIATLTGTPAAFNWSGVWNPGSDQTTYVYAAGQCYNPPGGGPSYMGALGADGIGMRFAASVLPSDATTPAFAVGAGTCCYAQIITPSLRYTDINSVKWKCPNCAIAGLDTAYPYGNYTFPDDGTNGPCDDSPNVVLNLLTPSASTVTPIATFATYLMYCPPQSQTGASQWVPLRSFGWSWNGITVAFPGGSWGNLNPFPFSAGSVTSNPSDVASVYPQWSIVQVGANQWVMDN